MANPESERRGYAGDKQKTMGIKTVEADSVRRTHDNESGAMNENTLKQIADLDTQFRIFVIRAAYSSLKLNCCTFNEMLQVLGLSSFFHMHIERGSMLGKLLAEMPEDAREVSGMQYWLKNSVVPKMTAAETKQERRHVKTIESILQWLETADVGARMFVRVKPDVAGEHDFTDHDDTWDDCDLEDDELPCASFILIKVDMVSRLDYVFDNSEAAGTINITEFSTRKRQFVEFNDGSGKKRPKKSKFAGKFHKSKGSKRSDPRVERLYDEFAEFEVNESEPELESDDVADDKDDEDEDY
jgi:hypothetical protein